MGRERECARIDALLERARVGQGDRLALRGEPGIGKTALLEYARGRAGKEVVLQATGRQSELELPYAALLELLRPLRPDLAVLDQAAEGSSKRFRAFAATLETLGRAAESRPLLLLLDDVQWFDDPSREALLFVVRRLDGDRVGALLAVRDGPGAPELEGIETMKLDGLSPEAAASLLRATAPDLAPDVRERVSSAAGGNPLALLELPQLLEPSQRAGRETLSDPLRGGAAAAHVFSEQIGRLSEATRLALLAAATGETDDLAAFAAVLAALGLEMQDLEGAEREGLIAVAEARFAFRHPLARSAAYDAASPAERRRAHRAHADALVGRPGEARIWHLALAADEPDEHLAAELSALGATGAAGANLRALEIAVRLTPDPRRRAERTLAAADAARAAGRYDRAQELARAVGGLTSEPLLLAGAERVAALVDAYTRGSMHDAAERLSAAIRSVEAADPEAAANMSGESIELWFAAGDRERAYEEMHRAWSLDWPRGGATELHVALRYGDALDTTGRWREGREMWLHAASVIGDPLASGDARLVYEVAESLFGARENARAYPLARAAVELARKESALALLPYALEILAMLEARAGRLAAAAAAGVEALALARAIDDGHETLHLLGTNAWVEAMQGSEHDCRAHIAQGDALVEELGANALFDRSGLGLLELGLGRNEEALAVFEAGGPVFGPRVEGAGAARPFLANLVEAEARCGRVAEAESDLALLDERTAQVPEPAALASAARCRGLLTSADEIDVWFEQALALHGEAGNPFEKARTLLCHGERLRRAARRADARRALQRSLDTFEGIGSGLWAARAEGELRATGARARRREPSASAELTPQELVVADLVAQGLTNREVATRLFLSTNTIETHLRHIFQKTGVRTRTELTRRLGESHGSP